MSNVSTTHPELDGAMPAMTLCRDVAAGARAVKAKQKLYLPQPAGMSSEDYKAYLQRAVVFGAFQRTITALGGAILTRPPSVQELPADMLPQLEDVTLGDQSLEDAAAWIVEEVLTTGRSGVLVDMPEEGGRPYWILYRAEDVVNWRSERIGDDPAQLTQVVLRENIELPSADGFGRKVEQAFRELALGVGDDGPVYQTRVWMRSDPAMVVSTTATPWTAGPWVTPRRRGKTFDFIPFSFVGPNGITPDVQRPPLEDLADMVIAHFRNSADHEEGLHLVALPTPWAAGVVVGEDPQPLKIGPSVCWLLEKDGRVGMNEFTGAGLGAIERAMAAKEKMMAVLGGRLLLDEPNARAETATSARLRYSAEAASLHTIAGAVSAALTRVLRWHVWWWMGIEDALPLKVQVRLTDEFFSAKASPEEVRAALMAVQAGEMSSQTFYALLQRGGWTRPGVSAEDELKTIQSSETRLLGAGDDVDADDVDAA